MTTGHRGALGARLDTPAIVAFFGGADELARALKVHKIARLTPYAIKQWCVRKHIPFPRRLDLEALAKAQSKTFVLDHYRKLGPVKKKAEA
jgi:hypothetical protein